jgi:hypothetical protein
MYHIYQGNIMDEELNPHMQPADAIELDDEDAPPRLLGYDHSGEAMYSDEIPTSNEDGVERDIRDAEHPRALARWLKHLRRQSNTPKSIVAMQMSASERVVTNMEKGKDSELSFVNVARYLEAIGMSCRLRVHDVMMHGEQRERRLILDAARALSALRESFGDNRDQRLTQELDRFLVHTMTKLLLRAHDETDGMQETFVCGIRVERVPYS